MTSTSWKTLGKILKEHVWSAPRWVIFLAAISLIVGALATTALTQWIKPVIDDIFIDHRADQLFYISFVVFFIFFMRGLSEYISNRCTDIIGQRFVCSLQTQLFKHLIHFNIHFFRQNHEGYVLSLLTHDVQVLRTVIVDTMTGLLNRFFVVIFLGITMIKSSPTMFWMVLWLLPVIGVLLVYCQKHARALSETLAIKLADLRVFFQQILENIVLVKSSNTEYQESRNLDSRMQSLWNQSMHFSQLRSLIHPATDLIAGISIAVGIFCVGKEVMLGQQTVGTFFEFIMALVFIYPPIKMIISLNTKMQEGLVSARRIDDLLQLPQETPSTERTTFLNDVSVMNPSNAFPAPTDWAHQDLVFSHVTFRYPETPEPLFQDFSCRFLGGKKMALVGNSGGGKTTLLYLLLKLYDPEAGQIIIGDTPLGLIPSDEWRKKVAFVGQEMALFSTTVAENIAYGVTATRDEIQQAAAMAYADEFIESLPNGYDTLIGTRGLMLSGGQRQRLSLARAFLRNSPIILLDEATSALDSASEKKIIDATFRLMEQRTTLMIAHRFSTIEAADLIFVLDHGHVVQQGSHHDLMREKGLYQYWAGTQKL